MRKREPSQAHTGFAAANLETDASGRPFLLHPLYGRLPLAGEDVSGELSLDFEPKLPPHARRADVRKQLIEGSSAVTSWAEPRGIPRYFYEDETFVCDTCARTALFSSAEQAHWYEELRMPTYAEPTRCRECRTRQQIAEDLQHALERITAEPNSAEHLLAAGRANARYFEFHGEGDPERALQQLRRARRIARKRQVHLAETWYWEGRVQEIRGNTPAAENAYAHFLEQGSSSPTPLLQQARGFLKRGG